MATERSLSEGQGVINTGTINSLSQTARDWGGQGRKLPERLTYLGFSLTKWKEEILPKPGAEADLHLGRNFPKGWVIGDHPEP